MCHACVIDSVKNRMVSRRSLFRGAAAVGVAVTAPAAIGAGASPAMAASHGGVADMTHTLTSDFPTFFGEQQFFFDQKFNFADHGFNLAELRVNEHTGTHMDAPLHFSQDGISVDAIAPENLVVPLVVIDIREKAADNADAQVTPDDIRAFIEANGEISANACVAMHSGWADKVAGDAFRNVDADGTMHFPGFHVEAAQMLMEEAEVAGIAVDTLSLDHGMSGDFATHYAWLPSGRWGIECMANLGAVPATGATLVVGAPKHAGGTGGPARVFTLLPA